MRPLPPRGDTIARKYWWLGLVAYLAISAALIGALVFRDGRFDAGEILTLFGAGAHPNLAVALLVSLGVAVTAIAAGRVLADIGLLMAEEEDVEWVRRTGEAGLDLVFLDGAAREQAYEARRAGRAVPPSAPGRVETLLDERVRRVQIALASAEGGVVVPAELRGIAEVRTAAYGAFARYASSLLLLLAVLGTFAGVKTALPKLIDAISTTTSSNQGLVDALNAVASAFGGNALALVGAVAVGLMAQGVSLGRRNLLERLELISAEYLYGRNVAAESNPMQSAIVALRDTAREMQSASGAMLGIEGGLQELGGEFRGSLDGLGDRLREIVVRQEKGMYDRTADALVELQRRMDVLARSSEINAQVYAGLAEAVGTRTREGVEALQQMRETNQQLGNALQGVVGAGQQTAAAFEQLRGAVLELRQGNASADARIDALTTAVRGMDPTFAALATTLATADDRLRAGEEAGRRAWAEVSEQVGRRLEEAVGGMRGLDERAAATLEQVRQGAIARVPSANTSLSSAPGANAPIAVADPEVPRLLRELVAASTPRVARPTWRAAVIPFAAAATGMALGGGAVYYLVHPAQEQAQAAIAQLQPTLERLNSAVERLQPAPARPGRATPDSTAAAGTSAAGTTRGGR